MVNMKGIGINWRRARTEADLSSKEAAACLMIKRQSLLNIETDQPTAPVSERLARRAARFYGVPLGDLVDMADASGAGVPAEPRSKEQETNTGPGPDGGSGTKPGKAGKTAPKRVNGVAA